MLNKEDFKTSLWDVCRYIFYCLIAYTFFMLIFWFVSRYLLDQYSYAVSADLNGIITEKPEQLRDISFYTDILLAWPKNFYFFMVPLVSFCVFLKNPPRPLRSTVLTVLILALLYFDANVKEYALKTGFLVAFSGLGWLTSVYWYKRKLAKA